MAFPGNFQGFTVTTIDESDENCKKPPVFALGRKIIFPLDSITLL